MLINGAIPQAGVDWEGRLGRGGENEIVGTVNSMLARSGILVVLVPYLVVNKRFMSFVGSKKIVDFCHGDALDFSSLRQCH